MYHVDMSKTEVRVSGISLIYILNKAVEKIKIIIKIVMCTVKGLNLQIVKNLERIVIYLEVKKSL